MNRVACPNSARRFLIAVFSVALLHVGCFVWVYLPYALRGYTDFAILYTAGRLVASGQAGNLYDPEAQWAVQQECCRVPERQAALLFNHAPHEALLFAPLSLLPYSSAYFAWAAVSLSLLLLIGFLLREYLAALLPRWWLLPLAALAFLPVFIAVMQGQDSLMLALFYTLAFACMKRGWMFVGGSCIALAGAKPQLVLPFVLVFALRRQWKMILGTAAGSAGLLLVSAALLGRTPTFGYINFLVHFARLPVETSAAPPFNMPNFRGLLLTLAGSSATEPLALAILAGISALSIWWAARFAGSSLEENFSAATVVTLLTSYHLYLHDVSLLLIAVIFFGRPVLAGRGAGWSSTVAICPWFLLPAFLYLTAWHLVCLYAFCIVAFGLSLWLRTRTEPENRGTKKLQVSIGA